MGLFGKKQPAYDHVKAELVRNLQEAEERYLDGLRREIANLIVISDPDLMIRCYDKAWNFEREITDNAVRAQAEEVALVAKFPMFSEFDLIGSRHFIPYSDVRDSLPDDELVERYHELSRMLIFMRRRDEFKSKLPVHDDKEYKILCDRMQGMKDRIFRQKLEKAMEQYYWYSAGIEVGDPTKFGSRAHVNNDKIEIFHLNDRFDNEYAIIIKSTGEIGIYTFHVFDDGSITSSYYRSDNTFKHVKYLGRGE